MSSRKKEEKLLDILGEICYITLMLLTISPCGLITEHSKPDSLPYLIASSKVLKSLEYPKL
jgi:hypothetical protein